MRVLIINTVNKIGSTGNICELLKKQLEDDGHKVLFAYGRGDKPDDQSYYRIEGKIAVYGHYIKSVLFDAEGKGSTGATYKLIHKINDFKPDIIHIHNVHGHYLDYRILFDYLKESKIKILWTLHDCWTFTGHCAYFEKANCLRWKDGGCYSCPLKKDYPSSIIDLSSKNYIEKVRHFTGVKDLSICTPSKWLTDTVKQSFLSKYPIYHVYNGIDLDKFSVIENPIFNYNIKKDKINIIGVASIWEERKGLKYFEQLANDLPEEYQIILVGLSDKQCKQLSDRFIKIKRTNNMDELINLYNIANVFVNPTMDEVLGLVNLEALACGTPVITFDSGGSGECINDEVGFLIERGNYEQLKNTILEKRYMDIDSKLCVEFTKSFSKENMMSNYMQLYKKIL